MYLWSNFFGYFWWMYSSTEFGALFHSCLSENFCWEKMCLRDNEFLQTQDNFPKQINKEENAKYFSVENPPRLKVKTMGPVGHLNFHHNNNGIINFTPRWYRKNNTIKLYPQFVAETFTNWLSIFLSLFFSQKKTHQGFLYFSHYFLSSLLSSHEALYFFHGYSSPLGLHLFIDANLQVESLKPFVLFASKVDC